MFQERVEEIIRLMNEYESYILHELSSIMNALGAQEKLIKDLCKQVAYNQHFVDQTVGLWEQTV